MCGFRWLYKFALHIAYLAYLPQGTYYISVQDKLYKVVGDSLKLSFSKAEVNAGYTTWTIRLVLK